MKCKQTVGAWGVRYKYAGLLRLVLRGQMCDMHEQATNGGRGGAAKR